MAVLAADAERVLVFGLKAVAGTPAESDGVWRKEGGAVTATGTFCAAAVAGVCCDPAEGAATVMGSGARAAAVLAVAAGVIEAEVALVTALAVRASVAIDLATRAPAVVEVGCSLLASLTTDNASVGKRGSPVETVALPAIGLVDRASVAGSAPA